MIKLKKKLNKKELDWVAREWNWKEKQVKNDNKKNKLNQTRSTCQTHDLSNEIKITL